ncbi:MAG: sulfite reductase [Flammeovirgaceae bacterium]|nr:sulfite reductase [Flammeovirgaceae bacterium]MBR07139.1 sulfite reductase [Rickettsiales bacterium]HCX21856.1 sulfite reductase [Cytophagales bacterium]|tara:strand:+ start:11848 stop:12993 length:1146 start_codon:yes stop_codon:yes gene_type:complete
MSTQKSPWEGIRKFLNDVHLWLGIASGIILFIVCFTGTVYTFHSEIVEFIDSEKYEVKNEGSSLSIEQLSEVVSEIVEGQVSSVSIPDDAEKAYQVSVRKEGERRGTTYLVNQYTGEVLGNTQSSSSEFFMVMFRLHRWLMLDTSIGRPIVGWATVMFVIIIITGLVIWFPKKIKNWRQGLKIKWDANWKRINHDLHNALGIYTAVFLLIMGLTGLQWSFEWYRTGLRNVLGVNNERREAPEEDVVIDSSGESLSYEELISIAERELDYSGTYRVEISENPILSIRKYESGFFASPSSDLVEINRFNGEVVRKSLFSDKPFNEQVAGSIKALHVGDVFGVFSKIIYFVSCLIATSLPVTGTIIWINKLRKKKKRSKALAAA